MARLSLPDVSIFRLGSNDSVRPTCQRGCSTLPPAVPRSPAGKRVPRELEWAVGADDLHFLPPDLVVLGRSAIESSRPGRPAVVVAPGGLLHDPAVAVSVVGRSSWRNLGATAGRARWCVVRVLLIEDDEELADAIATGLRRAQLAVDVALDGPAGLQTCAAGRL
jgi:CheY-like chemotaxis protein